MNQNTPAHHLTDHQIRNGLRVNIIAVVFGIIWFAIVQNLPLIMLLEALGGNGVQIGMISTLNQAAMLIQIPAALLADRLTRRKGFWFVTVFLARFIWLLPAVMLLAGNSASQSMITATLVINGISALLIQSSAASWWSWMADLIPDSLRSRFWNLRQGIATGFILITLGLAGWFLDLFPAGNLTGFGIILLAGAVFGTMESIIHLRVPEPPAAPSPAGIPLSRKISAPLRDANFRYFTLIMCVWFFGIGLFAPFTMIYLKQEFSCLYSHLSAIQMSGMLGSIATSFIAGRLINRTGIRTYGILMLLLSPLCSIIWFFPDSSPLTINLPWTGSVTASRLVIGLVLNSLIGGLIYAGVGLYQLNMLTSIVPREGRTVAMAMHWFLIGICSAAAPLLAGKIKDLMAAHPFGFTLHQGVPFSYLHLMLLLHAGLIWTLALPMARKLKSVETDMSVVKALSHILITNPLRMARDIYGFNGVILNSIEKTKDLVIQSAGLAIDAVALSAEKALDVVAQSADLIRSSADKAKDAVQEFRRNGKPDGE